MHPPSSTHPTTPMKCIIGRNSLNTDDPPPHAPIPMHQMHIFNQSVWCGRPLPWRRHPGRWRRADRSCAPARPSRIGVGGSRPQPSRPPHPPTHHKEREAGLESFMAGQPPLGSGGWVLAPQAPAGGTTVGPWVYERVLGFRSPPHLRFQPQRSSESPKRGSPTDEEVVGIPGRMPAPNQLALIRQYEHEGRPSLPIPSRSSRGKDFSPRDGFYFNIKFKVQFPPRFFKNAILFF